MPPKDGLDYNMSLKDCTVYIRDGVNNKEVMRFNFKDALDKPIKVGRSKTYQNGTYKTAISALEDAGIDLTLSQRVILRELLNGANFYKIVDYPHAYLIDDLYVESLELKEALVNGLG